VKRSDPNQPGSEVILPTLETVRVILGQAANHPVDHICRRLEAVDGREWFEDVLAGVGAPGPGSANLDGDLAALKELGKQRLRQARLTEEIEAATAIYFAAVAQILARPGTMRREEVCSLPAGLIEEVLITFRAVLAPSWAPIVDRALRLID
jgi:hypothetical protein